jgi:hypothetical protein
MAYGSPTYRSWEAMIYRCSKPNKDTYHRYGGRGINVCERWLQGFQNFLADMGEKPEGYELDRIDNDGDYTPENCRWITHKENCQNRNKRSDNISGIVGVTWISTRAKWVAMAQSRCILTTTDFFEACCARKSWENARVSKS